MLMSAVEENSSKRGCRDSWSRAEGYVEGMGYSSEQRPGARCADSQGDHSRMKGKPASLGESEQSQRGL